MTRLPRAFLEVPLAHRGLHDIADGRPENSRAAIRAAIDAGYGVEIDVQMSADGTAMVFHDHALDRLTEAKGALRVRTAAQLRAIPLSGGEEGIPDLEEVLDLVAGRVPVLIEVKDQDGAMGPGVGALETAVAQAVDGYAGPLALMSFNPHSVASLRVLCSDRRRTQEGRRRSALLDDPVARGRGTRAPDRAECDLRGISARHRPLIPGVRTPDGGGTGRE